MSNHVTMVTSQHVCMEHGVAHQVAVPVEAHDRYLDWTRGEGHIQNLLPELSPAERETLLTGTCQQSWDAMFAPTECDDDCDGSSHPGLFCK